MKSLLNIALLAASLLIGSPIASAVTTTETPANTHLSVETSGPLLLARSHGRFDSTMAALQNSIQEHGYSVAHIQKCDGGMAKSGYNSDYYRVVFFGKADEVARISKQFPAMIPYLPLKILIFAEQDRTVLSALNPQDLAAYFADDPTLQDYLQGWEQDLRSIMAEVDKLQ